MERRRFVKGAGLAIGAATLSPSVLRALADRVPDVVLRNGHVIDGTGAPARVADVAVTAGRIVGVGPGQPRGAVEVDARGMVVAPGFVDVHSHTDDELLIEPDAPGKIRQGVTSEVCGQDGGSMGPWDDQAFEEARERFRERGIDIDFRTPVGFLDALERRGMSVNLATMVGAGQVRAHVMGHDDRPPTEAELAAMVAEVEKALRAGACGVSTGLEYTPSGFADLDELVALSAPLAGTGLPYTSHMRNEDDQVFGAVEEALNVGRFSGAAVQVSHLKAQGERNWWKAGPILETLEHARADGIDVRFDVYPYVAYSTGLSNLFPLWSRDGGTEAFRARLRDPELRPRLEEAVREKVRGLGSWDSVQVTSTGSDAFAWARGRRVGELAAERGEDPYELVVRILTHGGGGMVGFGMSEENVARFLAHPLSMVCSDGSALAVDGPLSEGVPHPRSYGTFPRVLGHYVRERGTLPLELAIRKMTADPAARVGLRDRGRLATGMAADVVVFDPDTVTDRATFEAPHQYPVGIPHVLVNGRFVLRDGESTGELPGRALKAGR